MFLHDLRIFALFVCVTFCTFIYNKTYILREKWTQLFFIYFVIYPLIPEILFDYKI